VGPNMNSHNHPALTSIGAWMWRWFAGIRIAEEPGEPGYGGAYAHTTIAPYDRVVTDHARINSVRANLPTTHGDIALAWAFDGTDGTLVLNTTLPVNTAASVTLPSSAGRSWMKIDESGTAIYRSASSGGGGSMEEEGPDLQGCGGSACSTRITYSSASEAEASTSLQNLDHDRNARFAATLLVCAWPLYVRATT
jgi:hypothetical protein